MIKDKVSAIITTHNRADVLSRAIKSVQNQTYNNIELIVVSDGSTDGTDEFMKQFDLDANVIYISYAPSRGGNYARNRGIMEAKGEYIAFLDDDDEWLPDKIQKQILKFNESKDIGLVYVGKNIIYPEQGIEYKSIPKDEFEYKKRILIDNYIGTTSSVMVRHSIVKKCGGFDENLHALQDFDLWIRICQVSSSALISEPLINYYNHVNNGQISDKTELYENSISYIEAKYKSLYDTLSLKELNDHKFSMNILLAPKCMRNNMKRKSRHYIKNAFRHIKSINAVLLYLISFFPFEFNLYLHKLKAK